MTNYILKIYDYLARHARLRRVWLALLTGLLVLLTVRVNYKEDITDFLPIDPHTSMGLNVFQDISGADKVIVVVEGHGDAAPVTITSAVDLFVDEVARRDSLHWTSSMMYQVDIDRMQEVVDQTYANVPYFMTPEDYARIDSLMATPGFIARQLQDDKQQLMLPSGGLLAQGIGRDPLNLFAGVLSKIQSRASGINYEMYDGYIFSPDMSRALIMLTSPFGVSETQGNSRLVAMLADCASAVMSNADVDVRLLGGPVIAVGNASQIKKDSILAVSLAVVLILIVLFVAFRDHRNLLLIAVSIAWGWLFGIGCLSVVNNNISVIVVGISSVILGIAVNYPLHLIAHLGHATNKRNALKEIVTPLLVGNVTTVGAFLALVPLKSVALRDLGLFASFLLVGTIIFVLLYLPHVAREPRHTTSTNIFTRLGNVSVDQKAWVVWGILLLTPIFAYYSLSTRFDANMSNINYMTAQQKADMAYFQNMIKGEDGYTALYVVSSSDSLDGAIKCSEQLQPVLNRMVDDGLVARYRSVTPFLCSDSVQRQRLDRWNHFIATHSQHIKDDLATEASKAGFAPDSFDEFLDLLNTDYDFKNHKDFDALAQLLFNDNMSVDTEHTNWRVVEQLFVTPSLVDKVKDSLNAQGAFCFDIPTLNSTIAGNLSDEFNYIGLACSCIVFVFLWLSFGCLELAILAFIPMAVSWIWILGLMSMMGIQFNIVNVILATFIFGQGDDYTIFMTEGSCFEYAHRRKILNSYKSSIIVSALVMFIGIGTLVVAKHPALFSLAQVTIVGMLSVVIMAYVLPPFIFKLLVRSRGEYRMRPLRIVNVARTVYCAGVFFAQLLAVHLVGFVVMGLLPRSPKRKMWFRKWISHLFGFDLSHIPGVQFTVDNGHGEAFDRQAMIISNHQSMLDAAIFFAINHKCVLVSNENVTSHRIIHFVYKWLDCITIHKDSTQYIEQIEQKVREGYSIVMFPEGERNAQSSILRFHKGAFCIAQQLNLDIVPVFIHGVNHVFPRNSISTYRGSIYVEIGQRVANNNMGVGENYVERTRTFHRLYVDRYNVIVAQRETPQYYAQLVLDRYRYKGNEIFNEVKRNLKALVASAPAPISGDVALDGDATWGECALLMALCNRNATVTVTFTHHDRANVLLHSAQGLVNNLIINKI